ncbi:MAG TPA: alternative ribosome rescue aminoacyl-tRNA hydrolase ArfB [Chryseosolibacter sp.]|jgi:ribosome-associated protein|nr:alternative ribosome rescue aminoacyl-tRNA hydrolase ArfB [Chryseosolibacter sp.]
MAVHRKVDAQLLTSELTFSASRSSGPGGQNVNKVNSKVTLQFDVKDSAILTAEEKEILLRRLSTRITRDGVLRISAQDGRSQLQNKEAAIEKFDKIIGKAFERKKSRKATKPSKGAVQERINKKKKHGEKKKWRQRPV